MFGFFRKKIFKKKYFFSNLNFLNDDIPQNACVTSLLRLKKHNKFEKKHFFEKNNGGGILVIGKKSGFGHF